MIYDRALINPTHVGMNRLKRLIFQLKFIINPTHVGMNRTETAPMCTLHPLTPHTWGSTTRKEQ